jgi:hypothetical protein
MIYLIALLHAVPVFVIGLASGSRSWSITTAIFMVFLGVMTGDPAYMVVDLVAVGLALWICLASIGDRPTQRAYNRRSTTWMSLGGSNQTIVNPRESQASSAHNTSSSKTGGGDETRPTPTTSGEQQMGLPSAMRLSSLYDKRIRAYGLEPRELPPELHSIICSSFERRAERFADMSQMAGVARREFIETSIEAAADLLVLCHVGLESYGRGFGIAPAEIIEDLARTWIATGPEGSIELQLMGAVNQAGHLNLDFANAFKSERARQNVGIKLGRAIGYTGAVVAHGAIAATKATARFGEDVAIGAATGYEGHKERLAAARAAATKQRSVAIKIVAKAPAAKTRARA